MTRNDAICTQPGLIAKALEIARTTDEIRDRVDWGLRLLDPMDEWQSGNRGAGVVVAVLDTGVWSSHIDLQGAVRDRRDFSGDGLSVRAGHGTATASVIAGRANQVGIVGVAPACVLLDAQVLGEDGSGSFADIADGVDWAIDMGSDVINLSLGGPGHGGRLCSAIARAHQAGVVVVAASGNNGNEDPEDLSCPASCPEAIAVGALERGNRRAGYSNAGAELMAPGSARYMAWPPSHFRRLNGTSFACPSVAGAIALYLAHERAVGNSPTPEQVRQALHDQAVDLHSVGRDNLTGFGWVSIPRLLGQTNV